MIRAITDTVRLHRPSPSTTQVPNLHVECELLPWLLSPSGSSMEFFCTEGGGSRRIGQRLGQCYLHGSYVATLRRR